MKQFFAKLSFALLLLVFLLPSSAFAFPWDYDMYRQQSLKANEVAIAPVKGSIPLGYKPFNLTIEEAEQELKNPKSPNLSSVWRGQRLWNSNCWTCHGKLGDGKGPVGPQLGVPNILDKFYSEKPQGRAFAVIHYGLRAMPRYGYKFSDSEKWDIVNYLGFLQKKYEVEGMQHPAKVSGK